MGNTEATLSLHNLSNYLSRYYEKKVIILLLRGNSLSMEIDEQIVYNQLDCDESAIWSLLLAGGYLKVEDCDMGAHRTGNWYKLCLTNHEVTFMFQGMIKNWFKSTGSSYNDFIRALLLNDKKAMNVYMNRVALNTFSFFDTGNRPSQAAEPERFYHGFVLGLLVDLGDNYRMFSNRESGFGRYDVMLEPKKKEDSAYIFEFKVRDTEDERSLKETAFAALRQIEEKQYETELINRGITPERIKKYGFAFEGKKVLIESAPLVGCCS